MRPFNPHARPCELARPEKLKYGLFMHYLLYRFYDAEQALYRHDRLTRE